MYLGDTSSDCIFFFSFSPVPPEKLVTNGVLVVILNYCSSIFVFMIVMGMVNLAGAPTAGKAEGKGDGGQTQVAILLCCSLWEDVLGKKVDSHLGYPETCSPP